MIALAAGYKLAAMLAAASPGGADQPQAAPPAPTALAAMMAGQFATRPSDTANNFAEVRVRFANPALAAALAGAAGIAGPGGASGAELLYSALATGPERKPYRRRVYLLMRGADGGVVSRAFAFTAADRFAAAMPAAAELAALTAAELEPGIAAAPGADCAMRWSWDGAAARWTGTISAAACRIWSPRRAAHIALEAETRLGAATIAQTERGFAEDGSKLFGTAPGTFIELDRMPDRP